MKKTLSINLHLSLIIAALIFITACTEPPLDVLQNYNYQVEMLPIPKKINAGNTIEMRCHIVSEGTFNDETYTLRYFQFEGNGELKLNNEVLKPNDLYTLKDKTFRLYYTAQSEGQVELTLYFFNSFGKEVVLKVAG